MFIEFEGTPINIINITWISNINSLYSDGSLMYSLNIYFSSSTDKNNLHFLFKSEAKAKEKRQELIRLIKQLERKK